MFNWFKNIFKEFLEYDKEMRDAGLYNFYIGPNWVMWLDPESMEKNKKTED